MLITLDYQQWVICSSSETITRGSFKPLQMTFSVVVCGCHVQRNDGCGMTMKENDGGGWRYDLVVLWLGRRQNGDAVKWWRV
jgi:hypothetical protein